MPPYIWGPHFCAVLLLLLGLGPTTTVTTGELIMPSTTGEVIQQWMQMLCHNPPPAEAPMPQTLPKRWMERNIKEGFIRAYMIHSWATLEQYSWSDKWAMYRCAVGMGFSENGSVVTNYTIKYGCQPTGELRESEGGYPEGWRECVHQPLSTLYEIHAWQSTDMNESTKAENCVKNDRSVCMTKIEKDPWWVADLGYAYETTIVELVLVQRQDICVSCNFNAYGNISLSSLASLPSAVSPVAKKPEGGSACVKGNLALNFTLVRTQPYLPFYCGLGKEKVRYIVVSGADNLTLTLTLQWVAVWGWQCPQGFSGDACSSKTNRDTDAEGRGPEPDSTFPLTGRQALWVMGLSMVVLSPIVGIVVCVRRSKGKVEESMLTGSASDISDNAQ